MQKAEIKLLSMHKLIKMKRRLLSVINKGIKLDDNLQNDLININVEILFREQNQKGKS